MPSPDRVLSAYSKPYMTPEKTECTVYSHITSGSLAGENGIWSLFVPARGALRLVLVERVGRVSFHGGPHRVLSA